MKTNLNSRNNYLETEGIVDLLQDKVGQYLLTTSDVTFNSINVTSDSHLNGDLIVDGNVTIMGTSTIISGDVVEIKDNILLINGGNTSAGVTAGLSGIEIDRGTLPNYQFVFQESNGTFRVGEIGSLQCVATREDNPLSDGIAIFNSASESLVCVDTIPLLTNFTQGINTSAVYFKGASSNYITSDSNDNINFVFQIPADINVPTGIKINYGTSSVHEDTTTLYITNPNGFINAVASGINLDIGSFIRWNTNLNSIVHDASNLNLNSNGSVIIGNNATTVSQTQGEGVNLRSKTRTVTTTSSNAIDFNTFEGGIVNTAQTISSASTVSIGGPPTVTGGGTITNGYSLKVNQGNTYMNGDITITGNLSAGVSSPSVTTNTLVNITGSITISNVKTIRNGNEMLLSMVFSMTPTTEGEYCSFRFVMPNMTSNFTNIFDAIVMVSGYYQPASGAPNNIFDTVGYAIIGTKNVFIQFTASSTNTHYINVINRYTAN